MTRLDTGLPFLGHVSRLAGVLPGMEILVLVLAVIVAN